MRRLTVWFEEPPTAPSSSILEKHASLLSHPWVQRLLCIGMWVIAAVDYPTAASLSYLVQPRRNCSKSSLLS